jgi:hypothetical protein
MFGSRNQSKPAVSFMTMPVSYCSESFACGLYSPFRESAMLAIASGCTAQIGVISSRPSMPSETKTPFAFAKVRYETGAVPGVPPRLAVFCMAKYAPSESQRFATALQAGLMKRGSNSSMSSNMLIVLN